MHVHACRYEFPTRLQSCGEIIRLVQAFPQHAIVIAIDTLGKGNFLVFSLLPTPILVMHAHFEMLDSAMY